MNSAVVIMILAAIYAIGILVSARLLRYRGITWKHALVFGLGALLFLSFLPRNSGALVGLPINFLLGGWFFRKRGMKLCGEIIGWPGAFALVGIAIVFLAITMVVLFNIFR